MSGVEFIAVTIILWYVPFFGTASVNLFAQLGGSPSNHAPFARSDEPSTLSSLIASVVCCRSEERHGGFCLRELQEQIHTAAAAEATEDTQPFLALSLWWVWRLVFPSRINLCV